MATSSTAEGVKYVLVTARPDSALYKAVIALGDSQKHHVGPLPYAAWKEYADDGRVLAIVTDADPEVPLAYAAYRLSRNQVTLAHLVVAPTARGQGLARQLITHLSARYPDRAGITLLCRRDFPAHSVWPKLGFVPRGDRPGRGKEGKPLTRWWYDHGHPHLLTWQGAPNNQRPVVLDNNVFLDLHGTNPGTQDAASRRILMHDLDGRLEVLLTPEVHAEIDRGRASDRARLHSIADTYPSLPIHAAQLDAPLRLLQEALDEEGGEQPPKRSRRARPQDISDLRHVAYAAAAGVDLVVTRDETAITRLGTVAAAAVGVRLVTPQDLVTILDEEDNAPRYWPAALLGTGYTATTMTSTEQHLIDRFLSSGTGERKTTLRTSVRDLAAATHGQRIVYRDPHGQPVALLGAVRQGSSLKVPVLRLRPGALAASLAAQMISKLREIAQQAAVTVIQLEDQHLDSLLFEAAENDGYFSDAGTLTALTLPTLSTCAALAKQTATILQARPTMTLPQELTDAIHDPAAAGIAAALEHQLRPLRLTDAELPTLLVPIKPHFASQLFNTPMQLFGPPDHLGISREHVYYRYPRREAVQEPARILWYCSAPTMQIIACSALLEVTQGDADELWRHNRRLGVYTKSQVHQAAGPNGHVRALRVADTEVFKRPVSLPTLRKLAALHQCPTLQLISPSPIPVALFASILQEART